MAICTTPEPAAPLPAFTSPKTATGVIPRGFYKVLIEAERYLTKQIAACTFEVQLELKRWGYGLTFLTLRAF